jgi:hypothetical protein
MGNFTLPRDPCNFLNLRTSPWEILFLLLLCFSSLCSSSIRRLFLPRCGCGLGRARGRKRERARAQAAACGARGGRLRLGVVLAWWRSRAGASGRAGGSRRRRRGATRLQEAQARRGAAPGGHGRARLGRRWSGAGGAGLEQAREPAHVRALERRGKAEANGSGNSVEEE